MKTKIKMPKPLGFITRMGKELSIIFREQEVKRLRNEKANQGCPFMGYCPYDINDPFDCNSCPSKRV